MAAENLAGRQFGRLTAIAIDPAKRNSGKVYWACRCFCGGRTSASANNLKTGKVRSCGCVRPGNRTHGKSWMPEHKVWKSMRRRCASVRDKHWKDYGGRGIKVCARWGSFENFLEDMGRRPTPKHSLDRVDNNGDYEPTNCRWSTIDEQAANKRNSCRVEYRGRMLTYAELGRISGIDQRLIRNRHERYGWSVESAVHTPIGVYSRFNALGSDRRWRLARNRVAKKQ